MNSRIAEVISGLKHIASACAPVLRLYKVRYFKKFINPETKLQDRTWTTVEVMAYNREHAAQQVDPNLRPGYNCFATRIFGRPKEVDDGG